MGKELNKKSSLIFAPRAAAPALGSVVPESRGAMSEVTGLEVSQKPKTAIGAMAQFTERQSSAVREADTLREKLKTFDGSLPTRRIDPKLIFRSKWANRHSLSFQGQEFEDLKTDIESRGGNVQPIKVRPSKVKPGTFEIVFGQRRHQACLELNIDVLAMIEDLDEKSLFIEMDRENRQRKDLRPFEVGAMYAMALDEGLFSSIRKLSEEADIDQSNLSKAIALARLPTEVLAAFESPLDLQYRWAGHLVAAVQRDPDFVLSLAKELKLQSPRYPARVVFAKLTAARGTVPHALKSEIELHGKGGKKAKLVVNEAKGTAKVSISGLNGASQLALKTAIQAVLDSVK